MLIAQDAAALQPADRHVDIVGVEIIKPATDQVVAHRLLRFLQPKKGPGVRHRPAPTCPRKGRLLQRSGDVVKVGAQLSADTLHGGDDRDRDARCNQAILNGRGSGFVLEEFRNERLHGWFDLGLCSERGLPQFLCGTYGMEPKVALTEEIYFSGYCDVKFA